MNNLTDRQPSEYLFWKELNCKDGTPYPLEYRLDGTVHRLAHTFDNIRKLTGGQPLIVLSGYRTPAYNTLIGGAPASQHLRGRALDIKSSVMKPEILYDIIRTNALALGVRGLGLYETFVHFDIRTTAHLVTWKGYNGPNQTTSKD